MRNASQHLGLRAFKLHLKKSMRSVAFQKEAVVLNILLFHL